MARVERPPSVLQVDLEPGAEIHGRGLRWHTYVSQVSGCVACRYVERAAEPDRQMLEITADSGPLRKHIQGSLRRACVLVTECHFPVYPAANSVHAAPSQLQVAEQL